MQRPHWKGGNNLHAKSGGVIMSNKIISLVATIQCYQKSQDSDQAPNNLAVVWQFLRDEHVIDLYGYLIKDNRI